ncbi:MULTISPECIES: hypothetical protein [Geobacillus]|jgi:hypothetical protein|uniref:hypothetical protein n=1 Tax=Geobacillus TaxID=129337 RepID=UPI0002AF21C5|nr:MULTISPECIES: hypothetical protein [Geobacillus]AGE21369.1 hypothetical protein GHH_c08300 [Geobacillus sp. GHH01]AOL33759.1 hypothetical protein BGM21_04075 [Geobacillus thermoleovorans]
MGTSKRRLNDKIKTLLRNQPLTDLSKNAPEVTREILTNRVLERNLNETVLLRSFDVVSNAFITAKASGYNGRTLKELKEDEISREEFFESIIGEIEKEAIIDSKILKKAFKLVMVQFLDGEFDVAIFAQLLFYKVIFLILEQELYDTLRDIYEELSRKQIEIILTNATDRIFTATVNNEIQRFIKKEIPLTSVLQKIREQTSQVTFGEF